MLNFVRLDKKYCFAAQNKCMNFHLKKKFIDFVCTKIYCLKRIKLKNFLSNFSNGSSVNSLGVFSLSIRKEFNTILFQTFPDPEKLMQNVIKHNTIN